MFWRGGNGDIFYKMTNPFSYSHVLDSEEQHVENNVKDGRKGMESVQCRHTAKQLASRF